MSDKIMEPLKLEPGWGMLFQKKKKSEKQPDYVGEIEIPPGLEGRKEVSLWKRTSKAGKVYLSIKVSEPWKPKAKAEPARPQRSAPPVDPDFDDDLPF